MSAQDLDEASVFGTVVDQFGGVIPGAQVAAASRQNGTVRTAVTDSNGRFRIIELSPGDHTISVRAEGFAGKVYEVPRLGSGSTLRIEIVLEPEILSEEVTVEVGSGGIELARSVVGSSLDRDEISELPNPGEDVLDLVFHLAGTDEEPFSIDLLADDDRIGSGTDRDRPSEVTGAGSISLSGGAAFSTNITIDGMDNNDDRAASERFQPPPGAVEEVQVVENQFSAEYGRASGGRVNIRTRSGTTRFRSSFTLGFEDAGLNANTFNNNRRGLDRLPFRKIDPGLTVQGPFPFSRGRTTFLTSFLVQNRIADTMIDTVVPVNQNPDFPLPQPTHGHESRVDSIPNPSTDSFPAVLIAPYRKIVPTPGVRFRLVQKIDHRFSDGHSLAFSFQAGRSRDMQQYRETTRFLEETLQARERDSDSFGVTHTIAFGSNRVNQFRFQRSGYAPGFGSEHPFDPVVLLSISDDGRIGSPDRVRGTIVIGNSTANFASLRRESRIQFQNTLSIALGRQTLRIGGDIHVIRSEINELGDATGTFNFARVYDFISSQPSRYRRNFGATSIQENTYAGTFIQDDIAVREGLNISFGLRYERESILRDDNNLGPRIAIAWSPTRSGRSVIRVGGGIFYNRVLLRTIDDYTLGRRTVRFDSESLSGPSVESRCLDQIFPGPNASTDKCRFLMALAQVFPAAPDQGELEEMLASLGIASGGFSNETDFTRFVENGIRIPESYQLNIGFQRELGSGWQFEGGFTFNKTSHLWRETNVNAFKAPDGFAGLTDYLVSLETLSLNGIPTRFVLGGRPDPVGVSVSNGVRIVDLNSTNSSESSSSPIGIAFAALEQNLARPFDPDLGQVEMVSSIGRSVFEGFTASINSRQWKTFGGVAGSIRVSYTLSRTRDDGFVDTSSAQTPGDFAKEFSASGIDRRHKLRLSGLFKLPAFLGGFTFAPLVRIESGRPFNLGIGGSDRNLDDVSNDRPNFSGSTASIQTRTADSQFPHKLFAAFSYAAIGSPGNLPRNAGRGPALFTFDAAVGRSFRIGERLRLSPNLTFTNILNATVFSFGSDFVDLSDSQSGEFQRGFLVPSRTLTQRKLRLGIRIEY